MPLAGIEYNQAFSSRREEIQHPQALAADNFVKLTLEQRLSRTLRQQISVPVSTMILPIAARTFCISSQDDEQRVVVSECYS